LVAVNFSDKSGDCDEVICAERGETRRRVSEQNEIDGMKKRPGSTGRPKVMHFCI